MKIVVVSPHRGDAAFSLALTIRHWLAAGHAVNVVNCYTRSEVAPYSDAASVHPNDRMNYVTALRLREDQTWLRLHDTRLTMTDLNLKDAPLRLRIPVEHVFTTLPTEGEKSYAKIPKSLDRLTIDALVLPLAAGTHVDHLTARGSALLANAASGPLAFYEDLPHTAKLSGPEAIAASAAALGAQLGLQLQPVFATEPAEQKASAQWKRRAALCYDSQIEDSIVDQITDSCLPYSGRERLWANPLWRASRLIAG